MLPGSKNSTSGEERRRLAAKKSRLLLRARTIQTIRYYFVEHGYLEVETPYLIPAPAPEVHIDALRVGEVFLHTSPELCMKRLLSAGYDKIFQICRCFRQGERGERHLQEFTLLEWYHRGIDYMGLMDECEELILAVSRDLGLGAKMVYQGREINLNRPWERMSLEEGFREYGSVSMKEAVETGSFEEVMVSEIESHLGWERPTFLYDYPASLAALARLKEGDPQLAERFEVYMGGLELANAFSELTDVREQEERFMRERQKRKHLGKTEYPFPERFLKSLPEMPPSAGIALGVDRLAMLLADQTRIDEVVCFTPEEL
jgi:lysyl-tRNA synthetase class 2